MNNTTDLNPYVTEYMEKQILFDQRNKCAKKPYARIMGLKKYKCKLWKNKNGDFNNIDYKIIKIDDKHLALCKPCYIMLSKRLKKIYNINNNNLENKNEMITLNSENDNPEIIYETNLIAKFE